MSALDRFASLDETITSIRQDHAETLKACTDHLLATQLELELTKAQLTKACLDRDRYMRISTKLITQFAVVENVFSEAKALALAAGNEKEIEEAKPASNDSTILNEVPQL